MDPTVHSAPQSSADRLRESTQDEPGDKPFLRTFVLMFGGVIALGVAASLVIDPYGHFGTGLFEPRPQRDRDPKLQAFLALPRVPDIVIFGSSHVKQMQPSCVTTLTDRSAFNFGVTGGNLDDLRVLLRLFEDRGFPEQIILGFDPALLLPATGIARPTLWSRQFSGYLDLSLDERINVLGDMLWSPAAVRDDAIVATHGRAKPQTRRLHADGFEERLEITPSPDQIDAKVAATIPLYFVGYAHLDVSPARLALLRDLLQRVKRHGVDVVAFLPPLHPSLETALRARSNFATTYAEVVAAAHQLETEGLLRLVASTLADFGGDPRGFIDVDHLNAANSSRLLGHLYGHPGGCAVQ